MPKTATKKTTTVKRKTATRKAPARKTKSEEEVKKHIVFTLTTRGKWFIGIALVLSWYMPFLIAKIVQTCGF